MSVEAGPVIKVRRKATFAISRGQVRVWIPVIVALVADRAMTHDSAIAVVLSGSAALTMAAWSALDWLITHTALKHLASVVDDDVAVVKP